MSANQVPAKRLPGLERSDNAVRALVRAFGLLRRVMDPHLLRHGINSSQWGVLRALQRAEMEGMNDVRLKDLSAHLLVRPPSITGSVDRLQRMGLVQRSPSPSDQRVRHVKLTPEARNLIRRVHQRHTDRINKVLGDLNVAERKQLCRLLDRLASNLQAMAERGGLEG